MKRPLLFVLLLALAPLPLCASPHDSGKSGPSEVLFRAMGDELARTMERLRLEGLAKPHYVAYTVLETREIELEGSFGGLQGPSEFRRRTLQAEIRTGSRELDDFHYVGVDNRDFRPLSTGLPLEDDYDALRGEIWSLSDRVYKRAVQRLARKKVYKEKRNIQEEIPDLSEDPVRSSRETRPASAFDRPGWERAVREISAVFRGFPEIQSSSVELTWRDQHVYFVDSEGRSYVKPAHRFEIEIKASAQAEDGMVQSDRRELVIAAREVPSIARLKVEAEQLARDVTSLTRAPEIETYLGPVLLEEQAAGEFFSQLLASGVSAPRSLWIEQKWAEQYFTPGALTDRLGLRVIAPMFDVFDDPTVETFENRPLVGHYSIDEQGIPAERVELVEKGILKDLLMSRSPTSKRKHSNGHGRGAFSFPATASIGNLFVIASETTPIEAMQRKLREDAEAFGLDYGIVIRRIAREQDREDDELLAAPVLVYRVDVASGEEQLVRDARFTAVTLRALRDIVAASEQQHVYNLSKPGPYRSRATLRSSIIHPSILLSEMELTKTERKPSKLPYLEHPFFDAP